MQRKQLSGYSVFLHLVLVALAAQVVYLVQQNQALKNPAPRPQLAAGDAMEPMPVQRLDGVETVLDFAASDGETVLLVFTTTCPVCEQNQGVWKDLYSRFDGHYDIVGISVGDIPATQEYATDHDLPFPIFVPTEPGEFPSTYKISAVPQTILLDRHGKVKQKWSGPLPRTSFDQLAESSVVTSKTP